MGNAMSDPNFMTPIDLLSHLIRSCVTKGIKETELYSPVSLIQNSAFHFDLPYDEIKFIMTKLWFSVELINKQYNESILTIVLHLCWGDYENSKFFLQELLFSINIHKSNLNELNKRFRILKEIIKLEDIYQEDRIKMAFGLDSTKENAGEEAENKDAQEKYLSDFAWLYNQFYPLFALKIIKLMSDMCQNPKMVFYLTKNRNKILWVRDFLDSLKLGTDKNIESQIKSQSLIYDNDDYMDIVDSCIRLLSQVFPDGSHGFRCKNMNEGNSSLPRERNAGGDEAPESAGENNSDSNRTNKTVGEGQFFDADDVIFNVFSDQRGRETNIQNSETSKDSRVKSDDENKEQKTTT